MIHTHALLPDIVSGYELEPIRGYFSVIMPEAGSNLVVNPSVETNTTGYTAINGAIARTTTYQRRGVYSLQVTPLANLQSGVYRNISISAGMYCFSVDLLGVGGLSYTLYIDDGIGNVLASETFQASGRWERPHLVYQETLTANRRLLLVRVANSNVTPFYTDGWMLSPKAYLDTYVDGDQPTYIDEPGVPGYSWDGTPHASTSQRSAMTRAGGRVRTLLELGLQVTAFAGLGMAPVANVAQPYGYLDGALYQRSFTPPRTLTLVGDLSARTPLHLSAKSKALEDAFKYEAAPYQQPLVLRYTPLDACGVDTDLERDIVCHYAGGLEGITNNNYAARPTIQFQAFLPFVLRNGDSGTTLTLRTGLVNEQLAQRDASGVWTNMGGGVTGGTQEINDILLAADGTYYVTGNFALAGGVAAANFARYNPVTGVWTGPGTLNGTGYALARGPDGKVYVTGAFTSAGGVAADYVAVYDPVANSWAQVGNGLNAGPVRDLSFGPDGTLYIVGDFASSDAAVTLNRVAKLSGGAWVALGSGANIGVSGGAYAVVADRNNVFVAGLYATTGGGGTTLNNIGRFNIATSTWFALGSTAGTNGLVSSLAFGTGGVLYAQGSHTTAGGIAVGFISAWNGSQWSALGNGLSLATTTTHNLFYDPATGLLYIFGSGSVDTVEPDAMTIWDGSAFYPIGINAQDVPSPGIVSPSGVLTVNFASGGTAYHSGVTVVNNTGSADAYPVVKVTGPGYLYELVNRSTGKALYFNNLLLQTGETVTIDLSHGKKTITSNFRGDVQAYLLPGCDLATWKLAPGNNYVNLFVDDATAVATIQWRNAYRSVN